MNGTPGISARITLTLMLCTLSFWGSLDAQAQDTDTLFMDVADVFGSVGQLVEIPIYIQTAQDSLDGFQIQMSLSTSGIMYFEVDTVVVDSDTSFVCDFDTTGALVSAWELVTARSTMGNGLDLRVMGISSMGSGGDIPGIPNDTQGVLLRIFGRIRSNIATSSTVNLYVSEAATYYSNEIGELIDPVKNIDGSVTVVDCDCGVWGDVNDDGSLNPQDVTFMVQYVYFQNDMRVQPPACPYEAGDVNCDENVNPQDVTFMVQKVYFTNDMFCDNPCAQRQNSRG